MSSATKKKAPVAANQFDDADEEEDASFATANSSAESSPTSKEKKVPTNAAAQEKVVTAMAMSGPAAATAGGAPTNMSGGKPDPPDTGLKTGLPSTTAGFAERAPAKQHTAAAPSPSNPLDALAFACGAEEKRRVVKPSPPRHTSEEGRAYPVPADEISCADVLCGRGGQSNHHPGNIFFRRLVRAKQEEYLKANKREKTVVAKDIVKLIRMLTPPGRFLKKDPKDENVYVDVGDVQARNKASQALREGAPELREELRDHHSRHNVGSDVKLPYHGNRASSAASEGSDDDGRAGREEMAAQAAAAQGLFFAGYDGRAAAALMAKTGGRRDPPDTAGGGEEGPAGSQGGAAAHLAAEERARRIMMAAAAGPPGLGSHMMNPHLAGLGMGHAGAMNHYQLQAAAALQAAGGSHLLSPQALMMAGAPPGAAALMQATRARELAGQIEAANFAAATGINPMLLGGQQRGQPPFQDSMRFQELMNAGGNKRDREEREREIDENYAKAAKLGRQYL